jgi:hypothetical protein
MVVRELPDGSVILITQEDHAELSAQFAAHWGNKSFYKLKPYESMVFATAYHDSGYRDWEGIPPINLQKGRPYNFRETIPGFEERELQAYVRNVDWVRSRDPYAGLIVSMHRTGLWQNRYNTMSSGKGRLRATELSPAVWSIIQKLEAEQSEEKKSLAKGDAGFEEELWFNYRLLQLYDILSLYFCTNGYAENRLTEQSVSPVPVAHDSKEEVDLRLIPISDEVVRFDPYPLLSSPLKISLGARIMAHGNFSSEQECREVYLKSPRVRFEFEVTS